MFYLFVLLLVSVEASKFPKKWHTCKLSDPENGECLKNAVQEAILDLVPGKPSLGVLPIDPLHFDAITVDQGSGPVSIKLDFKDLDMTGIKTIQITKVTTDWKTMKIDFVNPSNLGLDGKYTINGKVLLLPITGSGHCNLLFDDFDGTMELDLSTKEVEGKNYYHVDSFEMKFNTSRLEVQFDNLFNGDKVLGENMNKFLNENWKEILGELKPAVSKAFGAAFKEIANRIFTKIDLDTVTPP